MLWTARASSNVAIAEQPTTPALPSNSRWTVLLLGMLLATGVSVGMAFTLEFTNASFRTPSEVLSELNIPVLAAVPQNGNGFSAKFNGNGNGNGHGAKNGNGASTAMGTKMETETENSHSVFAGHDTTDQGREQNVSQFLRLREQPFGVTPIRVSFILARHTGKPWRPCFMASMPNVGLWP